MTDIGNWPALVCKVGFYVMVPLNEYQIGNLLDALTQAEETGDWYGELQDILAVAMKKAGIKEVDCNRGATFTQEQVARREVCRSDEQ
jgi:hypothetical protein